MRFEEAFRSRNDHGAHRLGALDMRVVIDFNTPRRLRQAEDPRHASKQFGLRGGFGELAAHGFARIGDRMLDQRLFLSALRHGDLDPVSGMRRQRLFEKRLLFDVMREKDQGWNRLVIIELRQERAQHFPHRQRLVGARKIGPVAPVLAGAEEEHLNAGLPALLRQAEDIGLLDPLRLDTLFRGDEAHRLDPVAVARRTLEIELLGSLFHQSGEIGLHRLALAVKEGLRLLHQLIVIVRLDDAGAGR